MKIPKAIVIAGSVALLAGLAACSTGTSSTSSSSNKTPAAVVKTYSAADLKTILTTAKKKLGVSGTILDNAAVQAQAKTTGGAGGISSFLDQSGVTISPASCATEMKSSLSTSPAGTVSSVLPIGTTSFLTVSALANKALPAAITNGEAAKMEQALKNCGAMTMSMKATSVTPAMTYSVKISKMNVSTNADQTLGFSEVVSIPSLGDETVSQITAIKGNLIVAAESISAPGAATPAAGTPSLVDAVNAAVAAAQ